MATDPVPPDRKRAGAALASIPPDIVNLIGDARVTSIALGRGGAWIGSFVRAFDPPLRIEEAVTFAAQHLDGLRHVAMDLTHGARVWFDASFRFSSFEDAVSVATSRARLRAEHEKARKPHVRKKR